MDPSNNVKAKLLLLTSLLAIILIISAPVVNSVLVNLINPTETVPLSSSPADVFVDPAIFIRNYPDLPVGSTFTVHVNVTDVDDLFTWQLNMSWNSSILNASNIDASGGLLTQSVNDTSSEALGGVVINATNNVEGYTAMAESILGNVSGIASSGKLVSIEFLVVGYGKSDINMSAGGTLPTMLLNSTGATIAFTPTNGFFRNKLIGDIDGDKDVDPTDFFAFADSYLKVSAQPGYDPEADFDLDGDVDPTDFFAFATNYLKSVP